MWIHQWKLSGGVWAHNRGVTALEMFKRALFCAYNRAYH